MVRKAEKINNSLLGIVFALIFLSLVSCANVSSPSLPEPDTSATLEMSAYETKGDYVLQPGDVINIKFFYNPELNEVVTIRPDGKISLQLIDEVVAAGLTSSELDGILTEKYSTKLRHVDVAVIVKEFAGQQVYIGGEVNSAGPVPISGRLTALQAILQAGGYKEAAELRSVVVLRNQGTQYPLFMTLNLQEDLTTYTSHNDIFLKPYDIVFVPKTEIAKLSQFLRQHVSELLPVTLSFGLVYNLNPELQVK